MKFVCIVVIVGELELNESQNKARLLNFNTIMGVTCAILAGYTVTYALVPVIAATQVQI